MPEALASATPNGSVEYALNATDRVDLTRRLQLVLAPALGARHFELSPPADGSHTLTFVVPGSAVQASTTFSVTNPVGASMVSKRRMGHSVRARRYSPPSGFVRARPWPRRSTASNGPLTVA